MDCTLELLSHGGLYTWTVRQKKKNMFHLCCLCQSILSKPHEEKTTKCLEKGWWLKTVFAMLYRLALFTVLYRLELLIVLYRLTLLAHLPVAALFLKFSLVIPLMLFRKSSQPYINILRKNGYGHTNKRVSIMDGTLFLVWYCDKYSAWICSLSVVSIISS